MSLLDTIRERLAANDIASVADALDYLATHPNALNHARVFDALAATHPRRAEVATARAALLARMRAEAPAILTGPWSQ